MRARARPRTPAHTRARYLLACCVSTRCVSVDSAGMQIAEHLVVPTHLSCGQRGLDTLDWTYLAGC